jgi:hypothetical protein
MSKGVGSKEGERTIQPSLNLPEESAGTIEIAIPDQRGQTETKLGSKGPPDPGRSQATAPPFLGKKRGPGVVRQGASWCFF